MNLIKIDESFLRPVFADVNDEVVLAALFGSPRQPSQPEQTMKTNLSIKTDYIIGSVTETGDYSFSTNPKSHATSQSADAEVKRLARTIPGKQFVVFERKLTPVKTAIQTQQSSEWL